MPIEQLNALSQFVLHLSRVAWKEHDHHYQFSYTLPHARNLDTLQKSEMSLLSSLYAEQVLTAAGHDFRTAALLVTGDRIERQVSDPQSIQQFIEDTPVEQLRRLPFMAELVTAEVADHKKKADKNNMLLGTLFHNMGAQSDLIASGADKTTFTFTVRNIDAEKLAIMQPAHIHNVIKSLEKLNPADGINIYRDGEKWEGTVYFNRNRYQQIMDGERVAGMPMNAIFAESGPIVDHYEMIKNNRIKELSHMQRLEELRIEQEALGQVDRMVRTVPENPGAAAARADRMEQLDLSYAVLAREYLLTTGTGPKMIAARMTQNHRRENPPEPVAHNDAERRRLAENEAIDHIARYSMNFSLTHPSTIENLRRLDPNHIRTTLVDALTAAQMGDLLHGKSLQSHIGNVVITHPDGTSHAEIAATFASLQGLQSKTHRLTLVDNAIHVEPVLLQHVPKTQEEAKIPENSGGVKFKPAIAMAMGKAIGERLKRTDLMIKLMNFFKNNVTISGGMNEGEIQNHIIEKVVQKLQNEQLPKKDDKGLPAFIEKHVAEALALTGGITVVAPARQMQR